MALTRWPRLALEISGTAQAAPNQNLPGLRQFSLGGSSSVVGYPHFVKSGDSGFQARAQITCVDPCFGQTSGKMRISPFAFWDVGQVIEYRAPGTAARPREFLTSFGIGLNFQVGTLTLTSQLGKPLKPVSGFETDGEYAAYFGISYAF